jgi:type IV secretory pathway VirB10-like protein
MPTPFIFRPARLAVLLLLCCAGAAQAQFVWIGPNGTRQYSDQPPPPGTPASKILKAPGRPTLAQETPAAESASAPATVKTPTLAEREADYRKRAKAREEQEAKAQAEARRSAARAEYCKDARKNQRVIESGIRIADIGADGQRRYLSDAERAAAAERNAKQLADCR